MTSSTIASVPAIWGPALRTVLSERYGLFSVHAVHPACGGGFEAFPMDFTRAARFGVAGFSAPDMTSMVEGVRNF